MTLGDKIELMVIGENTQSLLSASGTYTETIHYEVFGDPNHMRGGGEQVLMSHALFLEIIEEVRKTRSLRASLLELTRPISFVPTLELDRSSHGTE
jgi:hypothetical protein